MAFKYFKDEWNYIDMTGCTLFLIGMFLRFLSIGTNKNVFVAAKYKEFFLFFIFVFK